MDIEVGIDLECTILPDDQLVEPDDGKSTPQAVNDIIDDLIWRIEFVVWTDDLCQCVNSEILFVVQNEICQKQVALVPLELMISMPPKKLIWMSSGLYLEAFVAANRDCCCLISLSSTTTA